MLEKFEKRKYMTRIEKY